MTYIYFGALPPYTIFIYIRFFGWSFSCQLLRSSFFMSCFLWSPLFYIPIIPWYRYIIHHFLTFCSRIVNIIAEIFIPHRVFVYKSWTIYKIQNVQNTKFFADYKIQNTKFIFYIDKILFLEHFKCPLFKGISFIFVNKWLIQQKKQ